MLGNLNNQSLESILSNPILEEVRNSVKDGVLHPEYCRNCIQAEQFGNSEREWHNNVNPEFDPRSASLNEHLPTLIDVRWNITCNLSCNYCGPYCSSRWAGLKKSFVDNGVKSYKHDVVDYVKQHKDQVREVSLVGGEPLLLEENYDLVQSLPDDCLITVITNANVDFENNKIFNELAKKHNVGWSLSFDNVEDKFEYVRHGGKWPLLQKNVSMVKQLMDTNGHHGGIHSVYNVYNCTKLCELKQFADKNGIQIQWQTLFQPTFLAVSNHKESIRNLAVKEIDKLFANFTLQQSEEDFFNQVKYELEKVILSDNTVSSDLREHIHLMETLYHKDQQGQFERLWPELVQTLG